MRARICSRLCALVVLSAGCGTDAGGNPPTPAGPDQAMDDGETRAGPGDMRPSEARPADDGATSAVGAGNQDNPAPAAGAAGAGEPTTGQDEAEPGTPTPGLAIEADQVVLTTEPFTLEAGQERFLCYAVTVPEDVVIGGYEHAAQPFVHHLVVSRALAPEPAGMSECDILFRMTWEPLFITGAGASSFDAPEGVGHKLTQGTQIVVQLHLLNFDEQPITDSTTIVMRRSTVENPRTLGSFAFGTLSLNLPPSQASDVVSTCTVHRQVELVAAFPHMHLLGTALKFEVGPSEDALQTVYERNPYDFDDQRLDPLMLELQPGDVTRLTCSYVNTRENAVSFGESTNDEMCFLIGFALDQDGISGCFNGRP